MSSLSLVGYYRIPGSPGPSKRAKRNHFLTPFSGVFVHETVTTFWPKKVFVLNGPFLRPDLTPFKMRKGVILDPFLTPIWTPFVHATTGSGDPRMGPEGSAGPQILVIHGVRSRIQGSCGPPDLRVLRTPKSGVRLAHSSFWGWCSKR